MFKLKLRNKTLITIGVTLLVLVLAMYLISQVLLINSFNDIEEQNTRQDVAMSSNLLFKDLSDLSNTTKKWTLLEYFSPKNLNNYSNEAYLDNLVSNSRINFLIILDKSGNVVYSKYYNSTSKSENDFNSILNYISQNKQSMGIQNSNINGIFLLQNDSIFISSQSIISNNNPSEGTLILGRYINSVEIEKFSGKSNISVSVVPFNNSEEFPQFYEISPIFSESSQILIKNEANELQGFYILRDPLGKAVLELKVAESHQILNQSFETLIYYIISFLVIGSILGLLILLYLDEMVLSRVNEISTNMLNIAKNGTPSSRLNLKGNDELSLLAGSINQMLASLEKSYDIIRKSRRKYKTIFQNTGTAMAIHEEDNVISLVNSEFEKLSGYKKKEIEGKKSWKDFFNPDDIKKMNEHRAFRENNPDMPQSHEFKFQDKNGEIKNVCVTLTTIPLNKQVLISYLDITQLRKSFEENEILIREIHHRVKNNFQIIDSLLNLQSSYIQNKEYKDIFMESKDRIKSMAMIHEGLYNSNNLARINFSDYLQKLLNGLFQSYGVDKSIIKLKLNADAILLGIDTAVPLGLLINELVTNSLKYAFPKGEGEIIVEFTAEDGCLTLIVEDNGIGLPPDDEINRSNTLGMQLIFSLVQQLEANIKIDRKYGTKFIIAFEELNYKKRT